MALKLSLLVRQVVLSAITLSTSPALCQSVPYLEFSGNKVWVKDLDAEVLHTFQRYHNRQRDWQEVFPIAMAGGNMVQGEYQVYKTSVSFSPRFPLSRGAEYRAAFYLNDLTENYNEIYQPKTISETLTLEFIVPAYQHSDPAVIAVYPSANVLPENQLKFHIAFNSSMTMGEIFKRVKLVNSKGKLVDKAFLVLDQELWDNEMKVATILLDPGRIKRGLRPNIEMGTALRRDEKYTLIIEPGWKDVNDNMTSKEFQKQFTVTTADRNIPNHDQWELLSPAASSSPLIVELKESMDYVMLPESFMVLDSRGHRVNGKFELLNNESAIGFIPDADWKDGTYTLYVNPLLEDLAGNNLNRLFDEDISEGKTREIRTVVSKEFSVQLIQN
jgi:hypothetical protein